jgi:hypothetical protein
MILLNSKPTDDTHVLKYLILILFPQLPAKKIKLCTKCAPLVGSLTVGNELDDLVHQTVLAYINVRSFRILFFIGSLPLDCTAS